MLLAVSKRRSYHADFYCTEAGSAKKMLREQRISILAVDYYLRGRDSGISLLRWAEEKHLLPEFVVITESDRNKRVLLELELTRSGYRTADGTTFIKQ